MGGAQRPRVGADARCGEGGGPLAEAGLAPQLVLGEIEQVGAALGRDLALVTHDLDPLGWVPLLYVCHSAFLADEERRPGLLATARHLLEHGADANAAVDSPDWPGSRWTPLYGAAGRLHDPELTMLLLEAGASPDDNESLYHSVEGKSPDCLRLLLEHGAQTRDTLLRGRDDQAATLAELGAATAVPPEDLLLGAIARGEPPDTALPAELDPDGQEVVILAALAGHLDVVLGAVGPNFRGVVGGSPEGTLLHHVAWWGNSQLVGELLRRGADASERAQFATPLAWAAHGSTAHALAGRDYVAVAELLVAAGDPVEPYLLDDADGPLYDWLAERISPARA